MRRAVCRQPPIFNESKRNGVAVFLLCFCAVILIPLDYVIVDNFSLPATVVTRVFGILFATTTILLPTTMPVMLTVVEYERMVRRPAHSVTDPSAAPTMVNGNAVSAAAPSAPPAANPAAAFANHPASQLAAQIPGSFLAEGNAGEIFQVIPLSKGSLMELGAAGDRQHVGGPPVGMARVVFSQSVQNAYGAGTNVGTPALVASPIQLPATAVQIPIETIEPIKVRDSVAASNAAVELGPVSQLPGGSIASVHSVPAHSFVGKSAPSSYESVVSGVAAAPPSRVSEFDSRVGMAMPAAAAAPAHIGNGVMEVRKTADLQPVNDRRMNGHETFVTASVMPLPPLRNPKNRNATVTPRSHSQIAEAGEQQQTNSRSPTNSMVDRFDLRPSVPALAATKLRLLAEQNALSGLQSDAHSVAPPRDSPHRMSGMHSDPSGPTSATVQMSHRSESARTASPQGSSQITIATLSANASPPEQTPNFTSNTITPLITTPQQPIIRYKPTK